ncbi:MAG: YggS family pyridoxal phosphate-dependent enzyme [Gallionellaceae bacterium]|jgi:pyridoxal phosphate enzyme (YggS family)
MTAILSNMQAVRTAIAQAATLAKRDAAQIKLLAVSKTVTANVIRAAFGHGQQSFGENYVQEALDKMSVLRDLAIEWHFIGPIQSNKTRLIAENFSWVHSVDRFKIAERLAQQRPAQLPALNICLQINVSDEDSKGGVPPDEALALAKAIAVLPHLKLRGLMALPAPAEGIEKQRVPFSVMRELLASLNQAGMNLDTLSMGMSHDMTAAIMEGATIVRVGTAIFGNRKAINQDHIPTLPH